MTYKAEFKGRAERELVELARSLSGLSQAAYTRAVLLKEAYSVVQRAQQLQAEERAVAQQPANDEGVSNGFTTETPVDDTVSGETPSESLDGNLVADSSAADDSQG